MLQALLARVREAHSAEFEGGEAAEAGFTLIELMVVLLILAILMAIAIPTFLGVTGGANDRAAQSNLTNAITEMSAVYQADNQSFTSTPSALTALGNSSAPEFSWTSGTCTTATGNCISVLGVTSVAAANDAQGVVLADASKTGLCWYAVVLDATPVSGTYSGGGGTVGTSAGDIPNAGTYYAQQKASTNACAASVPNTVGTGWKWGTSYNDPNSKN